jgi:ketosteroid isomerase-like protein
MLAEGDLAVGQTCLEWGELRGPQVFLAKQPWKRDGASSMSVNHLDTARRYLAAIEAREAPEVIAAFYADDVIQEEFPNRLTPKGARRDARQLAEASERGRKVMSSERYEILSAISDGDHVALEVQWTGTLAVPFDSIPAGGTMRARFAVFLDFRDGKINCQRNYDCFEPW